MELQAETGSAAKALSVVLRDVAAVQRYYMPNIKGGGGAGGDTESPAHGHGGVAHDQPSRQPAAGACHGEGGVGDATG